eukprot:Hpha_TRINITY_DN31413_c0_g1::TRINITY_DN31413_c0_g1_i1::g.145427::m.145427/K00486/KMO; kynurenine 3-monooxygenase
MRVVIAGAGPSGRLLAALLPRDFSVRLFERSSADRGGTGRFVSLLLSPNGERALSKCPGIDPKSWSVPVRGRRMHNGRTGAHVQSDWESSPGAGDVRWRAVDRQAMLDNLMTEVRRNGADVEYDRKLLSVDMWNRIARVSDGGDAVEDVEYDVLVGADGVNSVVRTALAQTPGFDMTQKWENLAYKWLHTRKACKAGLDRTRISMWQSGTPLFVHGVPTTDPDQWNFTLIGPPDHLQRLTDDPAAAEDLFHNHLSHLLAVDEKFMEQARSPISGNFLQLKCKTFHVGRVVLMGDAAHAMPPYFGQAMNCAFQDAARLAELLQSEGSVEDALEKYSAERVPEAHACLGITVRQRWYHQYGVNSALMRARIRYHSLMRRLLPGLYCPPLRAMVSAPDSTYAGVLASQERQNQWWKFGRVYE